MGQGAYVEEGGARGDSVSHTLRPPEKASLLQVKRDITSHEEHESTGLVLTNQDKKSGKIKKELHNRKKKRKKKVKFCTEKTDDA